MNWKVGLVVAFFVCLVIAGTVAAIVKRKNLQELVAKMRNPFLQSHATTLFGDTVDQQARTDTLVVGKGLALVSNFHGNTHGSAISKLKTQGRKIFIVDGEPNDLSDAGDVDLIVTTKLERSLLPENTTALYLPCYASFLMEANLSPDLLLRPTKPAIAKEFAVFCYSNCNTKFGGVNARSDFYHLMQAKTQNRVTNLGRCLASEPHAGQSKNEKGKNNHFTNRELFKNFKFVIAFENEAIKGYVSEKLVNPLLANSVPIYLGAPDVADHFNPKRMINVRDFPSFDACIDEVLRLDKDDEAYCAMLREPCFVDNKLNAEHFALQLGGRFYDELYRHVPKTVKVKPVMITANTVHFVTLTESAARKAKNSNYFDACSSSSEPTLASALKATFEQVKNNDLVVLCDPRVRVMHNMDHEMLNLFRVAIYGGDVDVVAFKNKVSFTEKAIIVRKTDSSVALAGEWVSSNKSWNLVAENYKNLHVVNNTKLLPLQNF